MDSAAWHGVAAQSCVHLCDAVDADLRVCFTAKAAARSETLGGQRCAEKTKPGEPTGVPTGGSAELRDGLGTSNREGTPKQVIASTIQTSVVSQFLLQLNAFTWMLQEVFVDSHRDLD